VAIIPDVKRKNGDGCDMKQAKTATLELSYEQLFVWLRKSFEENDAGYFYAVKKNGKAAYLRHCRKHRAKAAKAANLTEAIGVYRDWLKFFRKSHIGIYEPNKHVSPNIQPAVDVDNWETLSCDIEELKERCSKQTEASFEGIWYSDPYTIAIVRRGEEYLGSIISAPGTPWKEGQIKLRLLPTGNGAYKAICYLRDYSIYEQNEAILAGNNHIYLGFMYYERLYSSLPSDPQVTLYLELMETRKPLCRVLSADTVLLRIPSFASELKEEVDNLLLEHKDILSGTRNLIIDVRNNGGGSTETFSGILPYLYTNPTYYVGWVFRSSKLNIKKFKEWGMFDAEDDTPKAKKDARALLHKAKDCIGEFVLFDGDDLSVNKQPNIMEYPQQVAVIMNKRCASATENLLLTAKQSKKTKLYGTSSCGSFDISNMNSVVSPCKRIELRYAMTITKGFPEGKIDDIGIMPDFNLQQRGPEYKWIGYVRSILDTNI
jgi:hypothetical protein